MEPFFGLTGFSLKHKSKILFIVTKADDLMPTKNNRKYVTTKVKEIF